MPNNIGAFGENFPYTNQHDLNLDWMISIMKDFSEKYPTFLTDIAKKLNKPDEAGEVGNILVNLGNGKTKWENIDISFIPVIEEAVREWLDEHPEATTSVQDNSLTEQKLVPSLRRATRSDNFVSTLNFPTNPFITMSKANYTSTQGMCTIDDRYIVVCRYYGSNQRAFIIYDAINKQYVNESILSESEVQHVNSIAYYDGYLYVTTQSDGMGVVRLRFNELTNTITYDRIMSSIAYNSLAIYDGVVYAVKYTDNGYWGVYTMDTTFASETLLFRTNFYGTYNHIALQGMCADDKYLYIAVSGDYSNSGASQQNLLGRYTEYIYIFDRDGVMVKTLYYSRGTYNEIEDIDLITVEDSTYIVVAMNQNDAHISHIHVAPLFNYTAPITEFMTTTLKTSFNSYQDLFTVTVSESGADDFPDGTESHPFKNIESALDFIRRTGVPCALKIKDGNFGTVYFTNIQTPLTIFFDGGTINNLRFYRCGMVITDRSSGATGTEIGNGGVTLDEATIHARYFVKSIDGTGGSTAQGLNLNRSLFIGYVGEVKHFTNAIRANESMGYIDLATTDVTNTILPASTFFGKINGNVF